MKVELPADMRTRLRLALRAAGHREIGGVLMGEQIEPGNFRIVDLSIDSETGGRAHFVRSPDAHSNMMDAFFNRTGSAYDRFNYLGEWHSHPRFIVIEARGLRDWQGEPLEKAIPPSVPGRRDPVIVDVRQGLIDGQIVAPARALQKLTSLPEDIARRTSGMDRSDVSFVLGGLAPVPFLFLLGVIVDDEHWTTIMDWDRQRLMWRPLDDDDDGKNFDVIGLDAVAGGTARVCLCVSASYDVLDADVRGVEPAMAIVRMDLQDRSTASHWSEAKQQRLAQQFINVVMALSAKGIGEIVLFLAAPASLSLRLGTIYDRRNLPRVAVNQFEQADPKKFPWMVWMPVAGLPEPRLETR